MGDKKWHLNVITSTSDWMDRQVFPAMTKGVRKITSHTVALASARTNHRTDTSNCTDNTSSSAHLFYRYTVIICSEASILLCGVSLIFVVEPKFLLYV
jgi:hypothetical protein